MKSKIKNSSLSSQRKQWNNVELAIVKEITAVLLSRRKQISYVKENN